MVLPVVEQNFWRAIPSSDDGAGVVLEEAKGERLVSGENIL